MVANPVMPRKDKEYRLGILLVHGIGTQPKSETLVRWGDALIGVLEEATRWSAPPLSVHVERASVGDGSSETPAELSLVFTPEDGPSESWLLRECWWADAFPPPTYRELVSWSIRAVPWSIGLHVAQRYWQRSDQAASTRRVGAAALAAARLLAALALSPLIVTMLGVMLLLGLLPIPQLRSLMLAAQSALTATVGDSLAFVESPVRAALIRSRFMYALDRLSQRCVRTIVVAHSQGAAVVHEALGGIIRPSGEGIVPPPSPVPDTLLTFGAGINKLVALTVAPAARRKLHGNPVASSLGALLYNAVLLVMGAFVVWRDEIPAETLLISFAFFSISILLLCGLAKALSPLTRRWSRRIPWWLRESPWPVLVIGGLYILGEYLQLSGLPLILLVAFGLLAFALSRVLGGDLRALVSKSVIKPPGVRRWLDFYALADPVPNGPVFAAQAAGYESIHLWNEGSFLGDHTSYWRNRDDFVIRVLRECAATAESRWLDCVPALAIGRGEELRAAELRVANLRRARTLNNLGWLLVLVLAWERARVLVPQPLDIPPSLPVWTETGARFALLVASVAMSAFVSSRVLTGIWWLFVREEQRRFLAQPWLRIRPEFEMVASMGMGPVLAVPILIAFLLERAARRGATIDSLIHFSFDLSSLNVFESPGAAVYLGSCLLYFAVLCAGCALYRWRRGRRRCYPGPAGVDPRPGES